MSSVLDSLSASFSPDVIGGLGKALGADPSAINKGLGAAGPLVLAGMARMAGSPGGAQSLQAMLPKDGGGLLGNIGAMLSGVMGGGGGSTAASALLGPGIGAIGAALSRALGFNVTPLLGMVAPLALGAVSKLMKSRNLDASSLAATLNEEQAEVMVNPANRETAELVTSAMQAGDTAAATIASYGADWAKVSGAPAAAMFMVATSDLSGPMGSIKEAQAAGKAMLDAASRAAPNSVLAAAFGGGLTPEMAKQVRSLAPGKDQLIGVIEGAAAAVAAKSPSESQAYMDAILSVAQATAEGAKEGGLLGFGGTLVSKDEQQALDSIRAALA